MYKFAFLISTLVSITVFGTGFTEELSSNSTVQTEAKRLVERMRGFSMQRQGMARGDGTIDPKQQHRREITERLRRLGTEAVPALIGALNDDEPQMRRNAAFVMIDLAGAYSARPKARVDIRKAIPALIKATEDSDTDVRAWSAHALAEIGPDAKEAIRALVKLLGDQNEGPRNTSCIALGRIGPAAKDALPALREALQDTSDVRQFAQQAIERIQKE